MPVAPFDVSTDTKLAAILADLRETLAAVRAAGVEDAVETVFAGSETVDDPDSFLERADVLDGRPRAGVALAGLVDRTDGEDTPVRFSYRAPLRVLVRFKVDRPPGGTEEPAILEAARLASIVRVALDVDRSRGGNANPVMWEGRHVDATDLSGSARLIARTEDEAFYLAEIPLSCTWSVDF